MLLTSWAYPLLCTGALFWEVWWIGSWMPMETRGEAPQYTGGGWTAPFCDDLKDEWRKGDGLALEYSCDAPR